MKSPSKKTDTLTRVKRLHARAAHPDTPATEAKTALVIMVQTLNQHRPTLRYCYPKGTEVKVVPTRAIDTALAQKLFRVVRAHKPGAFMENQRVTEATISASATAKGYLPFKRHGYYLFVSARVLDIRY